MTNILILEDEMIYAKEACRVAAEVFDDAAVEILREVPSHLECVPDVAIVDIGLDGKQDGIQFLQKYGSQISAIVFYSVCVQRMKESFGVNVLGFAEKGEEDTLLREKLLLARQRIQNAPVAWLQDQNGRTIPVRIEHICFCSRVNRIIWFTDLSGQRFRTKSGKLDGCESWMKDQFVWISQSEAVNLHQIRAVDGERIEMNGGSVLYMSRRYRRKLESVGRL